MRSLSASDLLTVWEQGLRQSWIQRALSLLMIACPDYSLEQLANLSIGERDRLLLTLREYLFGTQLVSIVYCPACGDRLEFSCSVSDIRVPLAANSPLTATLENYTVHFRLPTSADLSAVVHQRNSAAMRQQLLKRCLLSAQQGDTAVSLDGLPEALLEVVEQHMAQTDPQADIQLTIECPACAHHWQATFDIVSFLWTELQGWAQRILQEVHILASAYGWRESDILSMSAQRRQLYLEMIRV